MIYNDKFIINSQKYHIKNTIKIRLEVPLATWKMTEPLRTAWGNNAMAGSIRFPSTGRRSHNDYRLETSRWGNCSAEVDGYRYITAKPSISRCWVMNYSEVGSTAGYRSCNQQTGSPLPLMHFLLANWRTFRVKNQPRTRYAVAYPSIMTYRRWFL